jgi:riboflavin-specific deaminase-like protein
VRGAFPTKESKVGLVSRPSEPVRLVRLLSDSRAREAGRGTTTATAAEVVEELHLWGARESPPTATSEGRVPAARAGLERPRVLLNMACTADGRATIGGRSGQIGNRADRELFHALRTAVDAVLVGAGTVRAEHYGRLVREDSARALRRARGLAEEPLACIVSASLALPADEIPLLADPAARVAVLTPSPASLPGCAAALQYVRCAREGQLDLPAALGELRRAGVRTVLCEGGPHLNAQLLAAGLVDELFLSLAPRLAGGDAASESLRIVVGPVLEPPVGLALEAVFESEAQLLLRYRALRAGEPRVEPAGGGGDAGRAESSESPDESPDSTGAPPDSAALL